MESSEAVRLAIVLGLMGGIVAGAFVYVQNPMASEDSAPAANASQLSVENETSVCVVFFYSPGCPHCANVEEFLDSVPDNFDLTVRKYRASAETDRFRQYLETYDVPESEWGAVPAVFVGEEYAIGDRPTIELLVDVIESDETVRCPSVE